MQSTPQMHTGLIRVSVIRNTREACPASPVGLQPPDGDSYRCVRGASIPQPRTAAVLQASGLPLLRCGGTPFTPPSPLFGNERRRAAAASVGGQLGFWTDWSCMTLRDVQVQQGTRRKSSDAHSVAHKVTRSSGAAPGVWPDLAKLDQHLPYILRLRLDLAGTDPSRLNSDSESGQPQANDLLKQG